ncbi:hypothetical protein LEN26_013076 [Aphanomyces euteiches]|nr:hypothetical protein AeMF1_018551 [Aphanomyces euteiches]KAH9113834.1 hypothetical protein LEN26_013076 [Aphanomyces euteiches]KAH9191909.1 hypothetical protein AeNC1_006117 [Aphanomyces euteiches]
MTGLVIFDYDWSLINDNSDTYVFQQLQPELYTHLRQLSSSGVQWTQAVDQTLAKLTCTKEQLIDALARIPIQDGMLEAVQFAHTKGCEIVIVSDANTVFIQSMLEHHNLTSIIKQVYTNPAVFEGNVLHVSPFHASNLPPHGCPRCPPNMCKGSIVQQIKASKTYSKIIYIGDGGGDFCPCATQLSSNDVIFAREQYELLRRLQANSGDVSATVEPWSTGLDILAGFQRHIVE